MAQNEKLNPRYYSIFDLSFELKKINIYENSEAEKGWQRLIADIVRAMSGMKYELNL